MKTPTTTPQITSPHDPIPFPSSPLLFFFSNRLIRRLLPSISSTAD